MVQPEMFWGELPPEEGKERKEKMADGLRVNKEAEKHAQVWAKVARASGLFFQQQPLKMSVHVPARKHR